MMQVPLVAGPGMIALPLQLVNEACSAFVGPCMPPAHMPTLCQQQTGSAKAEVSIEAKA